MTHLTPGDPAPWFIAPAASSPALNFHAAAGRWIALSFHGPIGDLGWRGMLARLCARRDLFDDAHASFFGLVRTADDVAQAQRLQREPGFRFFLDFERRLAQLFEVQGSETLVLDRSLRLLTRIPGDDPVRHGELIEKVVESLPPPLEAAPAGRTAPVLAVPRVFEPEFCRALIEHAEAAHPHAAAEYKIAIADPALREAMRDRIERRLLPEIRKGFAFAPTRLEGYVVGCTPAGALAAPTPRRANVTAVTRHRRFGLTIALDAAAHAGGGLRFPEFDHRTYATPSGGALVFSATLLYEDMPVTAGRRFCAVTFVSDESAAARDPRPTARVAAIELAHPAAAFLAAGAR